MTLAISRLHGGYRDDGPGQVLSLIAAGAQTRTTIAQETGLSRSTVAQRLEPLFAAGLIHEGEEAVVTGGRPSRALRMQHRAAVVATVDIGEERTRIAVTDLDAVILAERVGLLQLGEGPDVLLDKITVAIRNLLGHEAVAGLPLAGIGLGLPAPVDHEAARVMGWSIMSGWDAFDIRGYLSRDWTVPILIDNDVNLLTLAEHRRNWPTKRHLLYVKAGTGIGSGMIVDGVINRGALGAAGDIGHAHIAGFGDPQCRCGNLGCLEALTGGWAIARDLRVAEHLDGHDARDVAGRIRQGDSHAVALLRAGGRIMGEAVAFATSMLNPDVIVLGGQLSVAGDHLLAAVREVVYQRTLPMATRQLRIVSTGFRGRAGIAGACYLVRDFALNAQRIDALVAAGQPIFPSQPASSSGEHLQVPVES